MSNTLQLVIGMLFLIMVFMLGIFLLWLLKRFLNYILDLISMKDIIKLERKKIIQLKDSTEKQLSLLEMKAHDMEIANEKCKKDTEKCDMEIVKALDECFMIIEAVSTTSSLLVKKVQLVLQEDISDKTEIIKVLGEDIQNLNFYNTHFQELIMKQMKMCNQSLSTAFQNKNADK